jgi:hypothetical protein
MTLPNRLEIVKEFTDLAWQPRRSPNPVDQAVTEAHNQEMPCAETVNRS